MVELPASKLIVIPAPWLPSGKTLFVSVPIRLPWMTAPWTLSKPNSVPASPLPEIRLPRTWGRGGPPMLSRPP